MPRSVNGRAKVTVVRLVRLVRTSIGTLLARRGPAIRPRRLATVVALLDSRRAGHRHLHGGELLAAESGGPVGIPRADRHGRPTALLDERAAVPAAQRLQRHQLRRSIARRLEAVDAHGGRELVARAERRLLGRGPRRAAGRPPAPGEADDDGRDGAPRARPERQGLGRPAGLPALPQALLGIHDPPPWAAAPGNPVSRRRARRLLKRSSRLPAGGRGRGSHLLVKRSVLTGVSIGRSLSQVSGSCPSCRPILRLAYRGMNCATSFVFAPPD